MTPATSGPALPEPSAFYDPEASCWKMFGGMFPSASMPSLATLPDWGMTLAGALYELPTPALPIAESESSSLLATPRVAASRTGRSAAVRRDSMSGPSLEQNIEIAQGTLPREFDSWEELPPSWQPTALPTPVVNDMGAGKTPEDWDAWTERGNGHGPSLSIEAQRLLPTPTASDTNGAGAHGDGGADLRTTVSLLPTPRATDGEKGGPNQRGSSGDLMLPSAVQAFLPTPRATRGGSATETTYLLAGQTRSGEPTSLLSAAGSASRDEQPPDLLSLLATESD